ncbi:Mut7-C RNAse domain-containing protein [Kushneria sp. TE3]|uniref:Mut7-C RNAse domain-containing protein n=1 Tax=Kushneria sp. TE3 TaxID=3449832 RepID=UPI003F6882B1
MGVQVFFHGCLDDFLPPSGRGQPATQRTPRRTSLKDLVESFGVPHTEVAALTLNDHPAAFETLIEPLDNDDCLIRAWPAPATGVAEHALQPPRTRPARFVLDVHLGRLARYLRLLGFDVCWRNDFTDEELADTSAAQHRILLTRDRRLLYRRQIVHGYFVRDTDPTQQVDEVCQRFGLHDEIAAFRRCARCNASLMKVDKASVAHRLEARTLQYYDDFYKCSKCCHVYWQGSHFARLSAWIETLKRTRH